MRLENSSNLELIPVFNKTIQIFPARVKKLYLLMTAMPRIRRMKILITIFMMEHFILKSQILENQILLLLEYISEVGN